MCLTLDEVGVSTRTRTRTTGHTYSVGDSLSTYDSLIIKKKKKKSNSRYPTSVVDLYREGEVPTSLAPERTLSGFSLSFFIVVTGKTDGNNVYSDQHPNWLFYLSWCVLGDPRSSHYGHFFSTASTLTGARVCTIRRYGRSFHETQGFLNSVWSKTT